MGRVTLSAVSIAGAVRPGTWSAGRSPWCSSSRCAGRGRLGICYLLSSTPAGVRDPRAGIREPCSSSKGRGPCLEVPGAGPGSGRRVCHSGAVYVIRPGPFVCFRVCHSGECMFVIFRLSRRIISRLSRDFPGIMGRGARRYALGKIARNSGQKTGRFAGFAGVCQISDSQCAAKENGGTPVEKQARVDQLVNSCKNFAHMKSNWTL